MSLLPIPSELQDRLRKHLQRAALDGAVCVTYEREIKPDGESARLRSLSPDGRPIGDDRPYKVLKHHFEPLRVLSEEIAVATRAQTLQTGDAFFADIELGSGTLAFRINDTSLE